MKTIVAASIAGLALACFAGTADARGCITGAAAGGVAGHYAGHHGLIGAAAGCAVNHHRLKVKDQRAAAAQANQGVQPIQAPPPRP